MSVVVAIKDGDKIWLGCDSQVTYGYIKDTLKSQNKIWRVEKEDNLVMGLVGVCRDMDILSTAEDWIEDVAKLKDEVNFKYIVRKTVPKIFSELNKFGRMEIKDNQWFIDSSVTFAYKNNAYQIGHNGEVMEIDDILISGSGRTLGIGAWNNLKDNKEIGIKDKLVQVIKSACESDLYVNYPIVIMNTKDKEVEIIK